MWRIFFARPQLFVKTLTGKTLKVSCFNSTRIIDLKQQIQDQEGVDVAQIALIFAGKQLDNDRLVVDYNVHSESTLHMVLRARRE